MGGRGVEAGGEGGGSKNEQKEGRIAKRRAEKEGKGWRKEGTGVGKGGKEERAGSSLSLSPTPDVRQPGDKLALTL